MPLLSLKFDPTGLRTAIEEATQQLKRVADVLERYATAAELPHLTPAAEIVRQIKDDEARSPLIRPLITFVDEEEEAVREHMLLNSASAARQYEGRSEDDEDAYE